MKIFTLKLIFNRIRKDIWKIIYICRYIKVSKIHRDSRYLFTNRKSYRTLLNSFKLFKTWWIFTAKRAKNESSDEAFFSVMCISIHIGREENWKATRGVWIKPVIAELIFESQPSWLTLWRSTVWILKQVQTRFYNRDNTSGRLAADL